MRYRFAKPADFRTFQAMLSPGFQASRRVEQALVSLWQTLTADGSMRITLVEDQERSSEAAIQAIGASAFVAPGFAEKYWRDPQPNLAATIYEQVLNGQSPLLSLPEIREANSDQGLHLVMLHFALRNADLSEPQVQQVMVAVNAAFFFFYGGYRLNSATQEVYGRQAAEYMQAGGFHLLKSFKSSSGNREGLEPHVLLLRKDQVQPSVVNPLSFLFYPVPPRIHFAPTEQRVLELALLNESDAAISDTLSISLDAVKKTWRRIYQRAALKAPHLLGGDDGIAGNTSRGTEKRRYLLEYVRVHLEELRPHIPVAG
jgi:hypothetical protein